MARAPVYLDYHATTPCDPRVVEAMLPCFAQDFGNAASRQHAWGHAAAERVEAARATIASLLGAEPSEIVFTSGATESDNLAIKGVFDAQAAGGGHIVTAVTEHKAVLDACTALESRGAAVTYLGVDADGRVDPDAVESAIRPETVLVSLMLANNEIGTLHRIAEIAAVCRARGVLLHTDAAQALAHVDCNVDHLSVDLMSLSAHKAYGPQGVGALYLRRRRPRARVIQQMDGGGHERGRRSGTLNVPGIVGFGVACRLVKEQRSADRARIRVLRDDMLARIRQAIPDLLVNGSLEHRLPGNLNISVPGLSSDALLAQLDTVAISSGAACSAPGAGGSYVIKALMAGSSAQTAAARADGSLRIGIGRFTTAAEIERASQDLVTAILAQRQQPAPNVTAACGA